MNTNDRKTAKSSHVMKEWREFPLRRTSINVRLDDMITVRLVKIHRFILLHRLYAVYLLTFLSHNFINGQQTWGNCLQSYLKRGANACRSKANGYNLLSLSLFPFNFQFLCSTQFVVQVYIGFLRTYTILSRTRHRPTVYCSRDSESFSDSI